MEEFVNERLEICKKCPIALNDKTVGLKCDSRKWVSPDGKESSIFFKEGWTKGCGCIIRFKIAQINNHCPAKFW